MVKVSGAGNGMDRAMVKVGPEKILDLRLIHADDS